MKIISLSLLSAFAACLVAEARDFTDKQGRKLSAEIVSVTGDMVALTRPGDKQPIGARIEIFSDADQKFIREWAVANVKYSFDVTYTKKKLDSVKQNSGPEVYTTETWNYKIDMRNKQPMELNDLRVDYWLFTKADEGKGKGTARVKTSGSTTLASIKGASTTSFNTESVELNKTELKGNFIYIDGTRPRFSDAMGGIVIKVYDKNDKEVFKFATDDDLYAGATGKPKASGSNSTKSTSTPKK
jgi:hypothetical protein